MKKLVKNLKINEIGYSKEKNAYYFGTDKQDDRINMIEVEVQKFNNEKRDFTTLDSLLNGSHVKISMNSITLKNAIKNPRSILCSYEKPIKQTDNTKYIFVDPIGYDEIDNTVYSFNSYGYIEFNN